MKNIACNIKVGVYIAVQTLISAVLLLSFSACSNSTEPVPPDEESAFFSVVADSLGATTLVVSITPGDDTTPYLYTLLLEAESKAFAEHTDLTMFLLSELSIGRIKPAEGVVSTTFHHLKAQTRYTLATLRINPKTGKEQGKPETFTFATTALTLSNMTIGIYVNDNILHLTPTTDEPYIFFNETLEEWDTFTHGAAVTPDAVEQEINTLAAWYDNEGLPLPIFHGKHQVELKKDGFMAAPFTEAVNGKPAFIIVQTMQ